MDYEITARSIGSIHSDRFNLRIRRYGRLRRQNCGTANQPCVMGTISPDGKTITFNLPEATGLVSSQEEHTRSVVYKLVSSENNGEAFEFITTAGRQIQQVLSLIRLK